MSRVRLATLGALLALAAASAPTVSGAAAEETAILWEERFYNPKPADDDFVLPMPCGGAMAFRTIEVPGRGWLDDRRIVVGGVDESFDFAESARIDHISGSFTDPAVSAGRFYLLGKYEITRLQWAALAGDCAEPRLRERLPATRVNWYEAADFARRYGEWLYAEAFDRLPRDDGIPGFPRLPTEAEWEYAARGGLTLSEAEFQARVFPIEEQLSRYVWYQGTESANGKPQLTGLLRPNPLGLHDMLGNVEEIVLEPFRLSKLSRPHGQAGGFITKGGHYLTPKTSIRSAYRREYAHFDPRKRAATKVETIGFRLALAGTAIPSRSRISEVRAAWDELPRSRVLDGQVAEDPLDELENVIAATADGEARRRLTAIKKDFEASIARRNEQQDRAVRAAIRLGAFLARKIKDDQRRVSGIRQALKGVEEAQAKGFDVGGRIESYGQSLEAGERILAQTLRYYADTVIRTVLDYPVEVVSQQFDQLALELANRDLRGLLPFAELYLDHAIDYERTKVPEAEIWKDEIIRLEARP
jgi:hypothetical protein